MGGDIVPMLVGQNAAQVDFQSNEVPGETRSERYWRDVGTIDSYFAAHMDLCDDRPAFNLYNNRWPILTHIPSYPPAKFVHDGDRVGQPSTASSRTASSSPGRQYGSPCSPPACTCTAG